MNIELRPLAEIKPYEKNARINDAAVDAVAESIRQFGFRQPIVVDADGTIVCGHVRWKAAQKLGLIEVPVHVARDLTPDQIRAYRVADNKTADLATWDPDALSRELGELPDIERNVNRTRERIWFSPHCMRPESSLFEYPRAGSPEPSLEELD